MLTPDQLHTWLADMRPVVRRAHPPALLAWCPDCRRYFDGHAEGGTDDRCCDACWAWKYGGDE